MARLGRAADADHGASRRGCSSTTRDELAALALASATGFARWGVEHPAYAQLMFWRPVPGYEPAASAYAPAVEVFAAARAAFDDLRERGLFRDDVDLDEAFRQWTVLIAGVVSQQLSNAPHEPFDGGTFASGLPQLVAMFLQYYGPAKRARRTRKGEVMEARVDEIADRVYRISTVVEEVAPGGFSFNQFLIDAPEPLLFHTGMRQLFPLVREAIEQVMPIDRLRWISFAHVEADECGAMNEFLAAAPQAQVAHSGLGCMVSVNDLADRPPRPLGDGEVLELGGGPAGQRVLEIATPHVPHNWESHLLFEQETATLFAGDLFTQIGDLARSPTATSSKARSWRRRSSTPPPSARPYRRPFVASRNWSRERWPPCMGPPTAATAARCFVPWPTCMSRSSAADVSRARRPVLDHGTAMWLAATEYGRFHAMLVELTPEEWALPTDCPGWDVRAMTTHILGMADMASSPWRPAGR